MTIQISFRPPEVSDYNFILSSWLKSARLQYRDVDDSVYFSAFKTKVRNKLARKDTVLAVDPESPELILGYVNYDSEAIHYLYVKHALRNFGIASQLIAHVQAEQGLQFPILVSESSRVLKEYSAKNPDKFIYNPFLD
jgi:GNAT superfamily N-acetyltransferase